QGVPVVAQTLTRFSPSADAGGATTSTGTTRPATKWAFATSLVAGGKGATLAVADPVAADVEVDRGRGPDGARRHPESFQSIVVPAGHRVTLTVVSPATVKNGDAALLVDATGPIVAERTMVGRNDVSRSPGIRVP